MDVGVSVSLLRDELGAVIEQAVTAAVETVLGEMAKVVGSKFEEIKKEMTAKEKENESIKQMLEISRCQMKMMKKYLSALGAKDDRQVSVNQRKICPPTDPLAAEPPCFPNLKRTRVGDEGTLSINGKRQNVMIENRSACLSDSLVRAMAWDKVPAKSSCVQETALTKEAEDSHRANSRGAMRTQSPGTLSYLKVEYSDPAEVASRGQGGQDGCEPTGGSRSLTFSQPVCADGTDSSTPSLRTDARSAATAADSGSPRAWSGQIKAKEEESGPDIEIVCIKEEPEDPVACALEPRGTRVDGGIQGCEQQGWQERRTTQGGVRSEELTAAFTVVSCGSYPDVQCPMAPSPRQVRRRQWMREPAVCEDYNRRRAELKRRSQHRRRELEKNLPQPLLAALVRERREKTRLRVARWRAKRKLQASLMTPQEPAQLSHAPVPHAPDPLLCQRQPVAVPRYGGLLYGGAHADGAACYPSVHFSGHPLMPQLRHGVPGAVMQPTVTSVQQGMLGSDTDVYQKGMS